MKPNDYIYNSDTQSLANYMNGTGALSTTSGQVINGPTVLDSVTVSAAEDASVLKMAVCTSTNPTSWFPYKAYVATVSATDVASGSTFNLRVYLSAHRLPSGRLYFCLCSGKETGSASTRIEDAVAFNFKYRLITQPA